MLTRPFDRPDGTDDRDADRYVRGRIHTDDGSGSGWRQEYRPHTVDLTRAQYLTAFLRHLQRQLDALDTQAGPTAGDIGDAARCATALGITRSAVRSPTVGAEGTRWTRFDTDDMRGRVRHHEPPEPTPWP